MSHSAYLNAVLGIDVNGVKPLVHFNAHQHVVGCRRFRESPVLRQGLDDGLGGQHV